MKVKFDQTLNSLDGTPFTEGGKPITLSQVCIAALLANYPDEQNLSGDAKFQRYNLASKLHGAGEVDLSVEEIAQAKTMVGKFYGAMLVGPAFNAIEGK